ARVRECSAKQIAGADLPPAEPLLGSRPWPATPVSLGKPFPQMERCPELPDVGGWKQAPRGVTPSLPDSQARYSCRERRPTPAFCRTRSKLLGGNPQLLGQRQPIDRAMRPAGPRRTPRRERSVQDVPRLIPKQ